MTPPELLEKNNQRQILPEVDPQQLTLQNQNQEKEIHPEIKEDTKP